MSGPQMAVASTARFPTIASRGLVMNLDATNTASYPGTGTTWFDTVGGRTATLVNGPTFSNVDTAVGLGSFEFNGSNQYVVTSDVNPIFNTNSGSFTFEVWMRNNSAGGTLLSWTLGTGTTVGATNQHSLMELGFVATAYTARWAIRASNFSPVFRTGQMGNDAPPLNQWNQYVFTYSGTAGVPGTCSGLQGAVPPTTLGVPTRGTSTAGIVNQVGGPPPVNFRLAWGAAATSGMTGAGAYLGGRIGIMRMYNRVLTETEIAQNYNASRAYYGL